MNEVDEAQAWLAERVSELEAARTKLAGLEIQLSKAKADYERTNGEVSAFVAARDRVQHFEHQIEQTRNTVKTCQANVECARERLALSERQARVAELMSRRIARKQEVVKLARNAVAQFSALADSFKELDELALADEPDFGELRTLGTSSSKLQVADLLLLETMNANPGNLAAAYVCERDGYRSPSYETAKAKGLRATLPDLFRVEPCADARRVAVFKASLGDNTELDSLGPEKLPEPSAPAREVLADAVCVDTEQHFYASSYAYTVEEWQVPPDGEIEYRLVLPPASTRGPEVSRRSVELAHGLRADLVEFEGGSRALMPQSPTTALPRIAKRARSLAEDLFT